MSTSYRMEIHRNFMSTPTMAGRCIIIITEAGSQTPAWQRPAHSRHCEGSSLFTAAHPLCLPLPSPLDNCCLCWVLTPLLLANFFCFSF